MDAISRTKKLNVRTFDGELLEGERAFEAVKALQKLQILKKETYHNLVFYFLEGNFIVKVNETHDFTTVHCDTLNPVNRLHMIVSYNGTTYDGFQRQKHKNTVQDTLENVLNHLTGETITIHPSGRTDKGVHARAQSIHFDTHTAMESAKMMALLNKMLPQSIRVQSLTQVPQTFHTRYDALKKTYRYRLTHKADIFNAHQSLFTKQYNKEQLIDRFKAYIGTHDFKNFAKNTKDKNTIRTIYSVTCEIGDDYTDIFIEGNGFLHNMVRNMVGTVIHDLDKNTEEVPTLLDPNTYSSKRFLAPSAGLTLYHVAYDN